MMICSESIDTSSKMEMIALASSYLPFCTSHLGDSGNSIVDAAMRVEKTKGTERGNLQQIELFWW